MIVEKGKSEFSCPKCGETLDVIYEEETGELWYYCPNPDCTLEHYSYEEVRDV